VFYSNNSCKKEGYLLQWYDTFIEATNMYSSIKIISAGISLVFLTIAFSLGNGEVLSIPQAHAALDSSFFESLTKLSLNWSMFIELAVTVTFIFYPIVSALLDPKVFLDISGGGQSDLLLIWQVSRDIMNTIFAFMLIGGAMMTVIMAKQDFLKRFALKFILGIILVNFSWFFPRVILDISHVLTANIYQLPSIVGTECRFKDSDGVLQPCTRPTDFKYFPDDTTAFTTSGYKCVSTIICYKPEVLDRNTNVADGILAGLIMNHARLPEINKVLASIPTGGAADTLDVIKQSVSFLMRAGLQLLIVLYVAIIIVGMAVALLVRIPILWMTMAFMPLMFLGFVAGDLLDAKFNTMNLIFKKFLHAAFLPAAMAVPLSVGFILINALAFGTPPDSADQLGKATGLILPGVSDLWSFLWMLITIVVMWKGFRMALSIDPVFETATQGLTAFGGNVGNIAKNLPLNIPLLPAGKNSDGTPKEGFVSVGEKMSGLGALSNLSSSGRLFSPNTTPAEITIDKTTHTAIQGANIVGNKIDPLDIDKIAKAAKAANPIADASEIAKKVKEALENTHSGFTMDPTQFDKLKDEIQKATP
jgi:hypothetical protein